MAEECVLPEDLRRVYEGAVYEAELDDGAVIFGIGAPPVGRRPAVPLAIVTACNPGRARPGDDANREANRRLAAEIEGLGYAHSPALGRNADDTHLEPSFAIAEISADEAVALGRRFGQVAVFYWDGVRARILPCGT